MINPTLTWRRIMPPYGFVWVQLCPAINRYRWRCPSRPHFAEWSTMLFGTHDDAFENAKATLTGAPSSIVVAADTHSPVGRHS